LKQWIIRRMLTVLKGVWRVRAKLYLTVDDQRADCPKAIGHAFEVDGTPGANTTSALENAETSAVWAGVWRWRRPVGLGIKMTLLSRWLHVKK
jgi:hypothetical protein